MWTPTQLAYLAGILDGEGSFYIGANRRTKNGFIHFNSRVYVVNTNHNLINWLIQNFGGLQYSRKAQENFKQRFEWILDKAKITNVISEVLPYLIIKKKHAEIMLSFRKSFDENSSKRNVSEEIRKLRFHHYESLKLLNHRGVP